MFSLLGRILAARILRRSSLKYKILQLTMDNITVVLMFIYYKHSYIFNRPGVAGAVL